MKINTNSWHFKFLSFTYLHRKASWWRSAFDHLFVRLEWGQTYRDIYKKNCYLPNNICEYWWKILMGFLSVCFNILVYIWLLVFIIVNPYFTINVIIMTVTFVGGIGIVIGSIVLLSIGTLWVIIKMKNILMKYFNNPHHICKGIEYEE